MVPGGSMDFHNHNAHPIAAQQTKASPASASASVDFPLDRHPGMVGLQPHAAHAAASVSSDFQNDAQGSPTLQPQSSPSSASGRTLQPHRHGSPLPLSEQQQQHQRPGQQQQGTERRSPAHARPGVSLDGKLPQRSTSSTQVGLQPRMFRGLGGSHGSITPVHGAPAPMSDTRSISPQQQHQQTQPAPHQDGDGDQMVVMGGMVRRPSSTSVRADGADGKASARADGKSVSADERDQFLSEIRQLQKINASLQEEMGARDRLLLHQRRSSGRPQSPSQAPPRFGGPPPAGSGGAVGFTPGSREGGGASPGPPGPGHHGAHGATGPTAMSLSGSPGSAACSARSKGPQMRNSPQVAGRPVPMARASAQLKVQPGISRSSWPARMRLPNGAQHPDGGVAGGGAADEAIAAAAAAAAQAQAAASRVGQAG